MCRRCFLIKTKAIEQVTVSHLHACPLKAEGQHSGWKCDSVNEKRQNMFQMTNMRCESGITEFYQGSYVQRFKCQECDFDCCLACVLKYGHIPPEGITIEECRSAYFLIATSRFEGRKDIIMNKYFKLDEAHSLF